MTTIESPSPNHGARRSASIDLLVLHYTGMASAEAARAWLCDERSRVSAHYLVDEEGRVFVLVDEDRRAWHAGVSHWAGHDDINSRSIGIEIQNPGHETGLPAYPDRQIDAVIALASDIVARQPIPAARVLAHSDVAPGRKIDPGERFPWARLAEAGIGLWADPTQPDQAPVLEQGGSGEEISALQHALAAFGYRLDATGQYDDATTAVVAAFQRHWRPVRVDGRADASTLTQLERIAALTRE